MDYALGTGDEHRATIGATFEVHDLDYETEFEQQEVGKDVIGASFISRRHRVPFVHLEEFPEPKEKLISSNNFESMSVKFAIGLQVLDLGFAVSHH
ncbi:hypothetical protein Tco_1168453 [Tanacetum coccineum]